MQSVKSKVTRSEDQRLVRSLYRDNRRAMLRGLEALRRENRMLKAWGEFMFRNGAPRAALLFLIFHFAFLIVSGCASRPANLDLPKFDYEQSNSALRTPHSALPTRTWSAQWTPWSCPVNAVIFVQWSSNVSGPWQLAGTFPVETSSGNLNTPMSEQNFFRTGYTLTR